MKDFILGFAVVSVITLAFVESVMGQKVGEAAPDFRAPSTGDRVVSLDTFRGQWLVLYFYPRAFTPGCTRQACSLRDGFEGLRELNAVVVGVSTDSVDRLKEFREKYKLPFELISDHERAVSRAYGVLGPMGAYAKRRTFVISPEGVLAAVIDEIDVDRHAAQVRETLQRLQEERPR